MPPLTIYTTKLSESQASLVKAWLDSHDFEPRQVPHAVFAGKSKTVGVVFYQSGKLVVQGKDTEDFVRFFLEPDVLKEARLGYDAVHHPEAYEPHMGVDESGKGDYFGPMVISAVFATREAFPKFRDLQVRDSKTISSDKKAVEMAKEIRKLRECAVEVVTIGNAAYNRMHLQKRNVNTILGWGHARAIENMLLRIDPDKTGTVCTRALSDQFGSKGVIERALMERGKSIRLDQRHRAEEDLAVAAASIIARAEFIIALDRLSQKWNVPFPKGASAAVIAAGKAFVVKHGADKLREVAKLHFQTTQKICSSERK